MQGRLPSPMPPMTADEKRSVIEWLPLVETVARRKAKKFYRCPMVELGDFISVGIIGLLVSIRRFDPGRGIQFKTYAEFRIHGAMQDYLRDTDVVGKRDRDLRGKKDIGQQVKWQDYYLPPHHDPEIHDSFDDLIASLSQWDQRIFKRYFVDGMTQEAIGAEIGCSGAAVSRAITVAMKKLRKHFEVGETMAVV